MYAMEDEYRETRRLLLDSRNLLETLESASANGNLHPAAWEPILQTFANNLTRLTENVGTLRRELAIQPPSKREVRKARLDDLDKQLLELRSGHDRCTSRLKVSLRERAMREELLQRRGGAKETVISGMDAASEARVLDNSNSVVGTILSTGRHTLSSLANQRDTLRSARKKMLDVLHQAGVDRRIIARIERREVNDMILVYALMAGMLVLLGLAVMWKYHRRRLAS